MSGRVLVLLVVAGCRFGFGETAPDGSNPGDDGSATGDGAPRAYLFEDGFEGTLAPWNPLNAAVVDSGPPTPVEGAGVLRAQAGSATSARAEVMLSRAVGAGSSVFVRSYIYLPSGYAINDLSLIEIVQSGTGNLVLMGVPELGMFNSFNSTEGGSGIGTIVLPRDVWFCLEARIGIGDAPAGSIDIWLDGVLDYQRTGIDTFAGGIDELHTGVTWAGNSQPPSTVYVDDVIADDAGRIGCR